MTLEYQAKKRVKRTKRISITVSEEELTLWHQFCTQDNLSAYIRNSVNYMIQIQKEQRIEDALHQNQLTEIREFSQKNLHSIQKIEEDLIEIQVALAKNDIIPDLEIDAQIRRYLDNQLIKVDLSIEQRKMYTKIKKKMQ